MRELQSVTLGELIVNHSAARRPVKSSERAKGSTPYYGASGIVDWVDGFTHDGEYLLISEDGENLRSRSLPIAFRAVGRSWVNNHAHVVAGRRAGDTRFLEYALSSIDVTGYLTGSAQPKLNRSAMESIALLVPPHDVRSGIAEVLGALDDKVAANERFISGSRALLAAYFESLDVSSNSDIEEGVQLSELVEVNPRYLLSEEAPPYLDMKNLPETAMTVVTWSTREARGGARFVNGDTLLARITPCLENRKLGYVDFLDCRQVGVGSTEFIVIRARAGVPTIFPYFVAASEHFRDYAIRHMAGTTGRQRLGASDVTQYVLRRPADSALHEFGSAAEALMPRVKVAVDESRQLAATRDELLPLLMSGKVRVRDAEKIVEELV